MARRGRRHSGKKLEPPMPEVIDELHLPKYFGVIKGGGYNKAIEERREIVPGPMPGADEVPRAIRGRHLLSHPPLFPSPTPEPDRVPLLIRVKRYFTGVSSVEPERPDPMPKADEAPRAINVRRPVLQPDPFPAPAPEPDRVPLLIRAKRYFTGVLDVEPERPDPMPVVPELSYPALYTRFPIMKTVTKVTDSNGKIKVYFSHLFQKVPGVIITIKGSDAISCSVSDTTLTYFDAIFFKSEHDHGGSTDDDGVHDHGGFDEDGGRHDHGGSTDDDGRHTPSINADGNHTHNVQGTGNVSLDTKYGRLVMSNYTDYETGHVHTQVQTQSESAHVHGMYPTSSAGAHSHTNPNTETTANHSHTVGGTGGPSSTAAFVQSLDTGSSCESGYCITGIDGDDAASKSHTHSVGNTDWDGSHYHVQGATSSVAAHTHPNISTKATSHRHILNSTGAAPDPGHRHVISNDGLYDHFVYDVDLSLDLVASSYESPYHYHSADEVTAHDHVVAEQLEHQHAITAQIAHDHAVALESSPLLKNTAVTITYIAQIESA